MDVFACVYGHYKYVGLFKVVGDVVCVYASLNACDEDSDCYIPSSLF